MDLRLLYCVLMGAFIMFFKYLRNVYDSVKFSWDVMLLFQLWAELAVSDRSDRSKPCLRAGWLWPVSRTGLIGLWQQHCMLTCLCALHVILHHGLFFWCSHTLVAPQGCWDLGGVSFVLNMCNLACKANLWWISFMCTYWGGAPTKSENSKALLNIFLVSFSRVVFNH